MVGAGLAGSLLAILLGKQGHEVIVCERRPDPRGKGFIGGRSINLALSARGINALAAAGLAERVLEDAIPMRGRMMHSTEGRLNYQRYSSDPNDHINSVSRGGLNLTLLDAAAELPNVRLLFNRRCTELDMNAPGAVFLDDSTGESERIEADAILGADGAYSAVRLEMQKTDRFNFSQSYLEHGYKELMIPPTAAGEFAIDPNALHIWPRGGSMMIALPNRDKTFTCTLFWPYEGEHGFSAIRGEGDIKPFFEKHYPDAVPLMPTLVEDYTRNPIGSLVTVRCAPWRLDGRVAILGDAAHAIVPFYGQGMNCAFEDCVALAERIESRGADREAAFAEFEAERKPNADAIADMALDNFIEMRDKVGSRVFLVKKKFEHALHRIFPRLYTPLYNYISFTLVPYAEARARAQRQTLIVRLCLGALGLLALVILVAIARSLAS
ncbi:MAG: FAD-dependent monooxygenase [Phycisphaeraceae bacterium]|nr:MAG: FAD-dependent monooxygenase [Phycisphaeraceae bacterium]